MDTNTFDAAAERLGPVGSALWMDANMLRENDAQSLTLLLQACRIADHLDRLQGMLSSRTHPWLEIVDQVDDGRTVAVTLDISSAVSEFRQQSTALSVLLGRLGIGSLADRKVDNRSEFMKRLERMQSHGDGESAG